jgi:hypothetical protein
MQTPSKPRNKKRLFLLLGSLLVLVLAGLIGSYAFFSGQPAHKLGANHQPATVRYQQANSAPHGLNQTPGAQHAGGNASQDGTVPDVSHAIQTLLTPGTSLSGGGCRSYQSSSSDATVASNGQPPMYGYEGSDAPMLGLSFDYCTGKVVVTVSPETGYDYLRIDWWRPGRNGWTQYTTSNTNSTVNNVYYNTYYEVTVDSCVSHWYGDSCTSWSPRVYISTNA